MEERITVTLYLQKRQEMHDIEVPLDITANELLVALNRGYELDVDLKDITQCYLKTENPIALLKGNKTLAEYKLHNGTLINYTK